MEVLGKRLDFHKYSIALVGVFNFLLTPVHIAISGLHSTYVVVVNYSLLILSSSLIASNTKTRIITYFIGILTLLTIWLEFSNVDSDLFKVFRLIFSYVLFINFLILLIDQLRKVKAINLQFILGPILGFIYLGLIGGILYETIYFLNPNAFHITRGFSGYGFYYFSFISITTVGYGDIIPLTAAAQSLTLVMNIIGQFYLATVIGVFVGKYINVKT